MKRIPGKIRSYLFNTEIDINERLGAFFINIGIVAAILGVALCLIARVPVSGTISTALIAAGAPLIAAITRHTEKAEKYGALVAVLIIFMIPVVWLTTGALTSGSAFWFLYELFYISLFTRKKQLLPYFAAAIGVQAAAIAADWFYPDLFFHFTDRFYALISMVGSAVIVTAEIVITVYVQKTLYTHEREINTRTQDTTRNFVTSIANTIDTKDPYTGGHSRRVAECASAIGLRLGMSQEEADNLRTVGLLHDIGKIGVPDRVLNKPGKLTQEEFGMIRRHPIYGAEILKDITSIPHVCDGILYHHERYDGSGYPEGLKGEDIPFIARIISVADSYDAMSTNRIYRKSIKREEIINEMVRCRGTQFDPYIVDVFVQMLLEGYGMESDPENDADSVEGNLAITASEMMRRIMEEEELTLKKSGTTLVDNTEFTRLYDYLSSLSRREGDSMLLINISLDLEADKTDKDRLLDCMVDLNTAITRNIRAVDVCTHNSATSFLVLLLNAPREHVGYIIERIRSEFHRLQGNTDVVLHHSFVENGPEYFKDQEN